MRKVEIAIPPILSEIIALQYESLKSVHHYSDAIVRDPDAHHSIIPLYRDQAAAAVILMQRVDKRIPKRRRVEFAKQVKLTDPLAMENIKALAIRMTAEQREMFESVGEAILSGEFTLEMVDQL